MVALPQRESDLVRLAVEVRHFAEWMGMNPNAAAHFLLVQLQIQRGNDIVVSRPVVAPPEISAEIPLQSLGRAMEIVDEFRKVDVFGEGARVLELDSLTAPDEMELEVGVSSEQIQCDLCRALAGSDDREALWRALALDCVEAEEIIGRMEYALVVCAGEDSRHQGRPPRRERNRA